METLRKQLSEIGSFVFNECCLTYEMRNDIVLYRESGGIQDEKECKNGLKWS